MAATATARARRLTLWLAGGLLALVIVLALIAIGGTVAALRSPTATAWLLSKVPGVRVEGLSGAPLGDSIGAERLVWTGTAGRLEIEQLLASDVRWTWRPTPTAWLGLAVGEMRARRVAWTSSAEPAPPGDPPRVPGSLALPFEVQLPLRVKTLQIDTLAPVQDLSLTLHAGADGGAEHRVEALALRWDRLRAEGRLKLAATAPYALALDLQARSTAGAALPWQATSTAGGTLERIELEARLSSDAGRGAASLRATSTLTPFERWPLAALAAETQALDLSALSSALPQTRLQGRAVLRSRALDQPMQAELQASNRAPGRWDEGRLPLREIALAIEATPTSPERVAISRFDIGFGDAAANAGRWRGAGQWLGSRLTLDTRIEALTPQRLDGRAAPMQLDGPVSLVVDALPSPDPAAAAPAGPITVSLDTRLDGLVEGAPQPVQLALKARARDGLVELEQLRANAGAARAEASASARRGAAGWAFESRGELVDFDPLPWWQGPAGSSWRRGPHRLNGRWTLALTLPSGAERLPPMQVLQRLAGQGRVVIDSSQLAGVPLSAQVDLRQETGTRIAATLDAGGNRIVLDGRARPLGDGADDRWQLDVNAPALAALAPIVALAPDAAAWAPKQGQLVAQLRASGRWPALRTEGEAKVEALRSGPLGLERASFEWQLASDRDAPVSARLNATRLAWGEQRVPAVRAELGGSWRAHQLRASAELPLQPPPALTRSLALREGAGARIELRADGGWTPEAGGSRWAGRVQQLAAGVWDGRGVAADAVPATDWLDARDLRAELEFDAAGGLRRAHANAGRLKLAGDIALRWDDILYAPASGSTRLQLKAEVETFAIAPVLARWQPTMGWSGDLRIGARIDLRAGERFDADIVIERESGDLRVNDGTDTPLPLGLTDLRLALNAHDGQWLFTQGLAGKTLGELGGLLRVRARPQDLWPAADAPIDGSVLLRVGNLAIWGAWVPPGWRLAGSLQTSGSFAGTFGAPQVTGELRGENLGVRNLLQGVNVTDGQVTMRLEGERATIERFTLRGGEGRLTLTGGAELGAKPTARLSLQAERFQLLGRIDRRIVTSGRAELRLDADALDLTGRFNVDQGLIDASRADAPSLDDDVVVRRPDAPPPRDDEDAEAAPKRAIRVALTVDLGDELTVRGRGLDTKLAGELRISAPGGRLAVFGTVRTVGGTYAAYGQKMVIERGIVAFSGPVDSPRLDVLALRPKLDVEVGVAITGSVQTPRIRLHSNPDMSDTDKLSWLVLGKAPERLGRADTALLQRAAIALLSGEEAGPTDALLRNLGLDEFSVRQSEDGDVRETVVSLGKQISERWYVGYERGVNATSGTWQLIYRVAQRFTLRAQSGQENAIDLIWTWRVR